MRASAEATAASEGRSGRLMTAALAYQRLMDRVSDLLGRLSAWLVLVLVAVGFANVVLRYVGEAVGRRLTTNDLIEAQWYLYGILFLLALPSVLGKGLNVRVDFWFAAQPPRRKAWIDAAGHLVGLLPFALLGVLISVPAVRRSWRIAETTPERGLPLAPIKTVLLAAMVLLLMQGLAEMVKLVWVLRGGSEPAGTTGGPAADDGTGPAVSALGGRAGADRAEALAPDAPLRIE